MPSQERLLFTDIFAEVSRRGLVPSDIATTLLAKLKDADSGLYAQGHARITDYPCETDAERLEQRLAHEEYDRIRCLLDDDWKHPRRNLIFPPSHWDDDQTYIPDPADEPPLPGIFPAEKAPMPLQEREALQAQLLQLSAIIHRDVRSIERAPNSAKYPIPCYVWNMLDIVDKRGQSSWVDDEEKPHDFVSLDWFMGTCEWNDSYPDEENYSTVWQLSNLEVVGIGLRKAIFAKDAVHHSSPDDETVKRFMESAVRDGLSQIKAREEWWSIYPGRGARDDLDAIFRDAHLSVKGILPQVGRPRKLPD